MRSAWLPLTTNSTRAYRRCDALREWLPSRLSRPDLERLLSRRLPQELPRIWWHDQPLAMLCACRGEAPPLAARALRERFAGRSRLHKFVHNDLTPRQPKAVGLKVVQSSSWIQRRLLCSMRQPPAIGIERASARFRGEGSEAPHP